STRYASSLHDALPIFGVAGQRHRRAESADLAGVGALQCGHDVVCVVGGQFDTSAGQWRVVAAVAPLFQFSDDLAQLIAVQLHVGSEEHTSELQSRFDL